jgi:hypothetical protein
MKLHTTEEIATIASPATTHRSELVPLRIAIKKIDTSPKAAPANQSGKVSIPVCPSPGARMAKNEPMQMKNAPSKAHMPGRSSFPKTLDLGPGNMPLARHSV